MSWLFRTYVSPTGRMVVQKDIDSQSPVVIQHFSTRIRYLANTPKVEWHEPQAKKLSGAGDLYEIRFQATIQYRPLGYFGPGDDEFTILIWASKKGSVWTPAEAIATAIERKKKILRGEAGCASLQIDGEKFPPT